MYSKKSLFKLGMAIVITVGISACAGVKTSSYSFDDNYKTNVPTKSDGCYDTIKQLSFCKLRAAVIQPPC